MRNNTLISILAVVLLCYLTSYIVYFIFVSNYSVNYFSKSSFASVYDYGVYRYRILSQFLLKLVSNFLDSHYPVKGTMKFIQFLDPHGSPNFYKAFFYLNTFFLTLTSVISVFLLNTKPFSKINGGDRLLLLYFIPIIINFTQFCVVPYDTIGYFLELLTLYVFLRHFEKHFLPALAVMCVLTILSTLNRESSVLTVLLVGILLFSREGISDRTVVSALALFLSFYGTYFCLHYFIAGIPGFVEHLAGNYRWYPNQLGILFWLLFFYLAISISSTRLNRQTIVAFHLISLPYIYYIFFNAIAAEMRLYIPLLLGSMFIARLDDGYLKFPPGKLLQMAFKNPWRRKPAQS
jgi:hypothetical protein